jgi:hypothetical protein
MATFPSLSPSAAPITPGAWPVSAITSLNGAESRIRQGSAQIGRRLQLTFTNITEANFLAILAHYQGQRSGFDPFGFNTTTLAADLTPSGHAWLYTSRPQAVDEHLDVFTVVCEFKSEPRGLVVAVGKAWRTGATTLVAGIATDSRSVAAGKQWATTSTTLNPGVRNSGVGSNGVRWATDSTVLDTGARDQYFSSVSLLLHMDGANGSTTFTDSGPLGLTVTGGNGASIITTANSRSNGSAADFASTTTNKYLSISGSQIGQMGNFGTGDFTIELTQYSTNVDSTRALITVGDYDTGGNGFYCWLQGNLPVFSANGGVNYVGSASVFSGILNHIAFVRASGVLTIWVNGASVYSGAMTLSFTPSGGSKTSSGAVAAISDMIFHNSSRSFVDEIRITKGVARYTFSFTPPSGSFPNQ